MTHLFTPLKIKDMTLKNRMVMAPMCMYSASDNGMATISMWFTMQQERLDKSVYHG